MTVYVCEKPQKAREKYKVIEYDGVEAVQETKKNDYKLIINCNAISVDKEKCKIKCFGF